MAPTEKRIEYVIKLLGSITDEQLRMMEKIINEENDLTIKNPNELDCPFDFTSRCTMGRCNCKPKNVE